MASHTKNMDDRYSKPYFGGVESTFGGAERRTHHNKMHWLVVDLASTLVAFLVCVCVSLEQRSAFQFRAIVITYPSLMA